MKKLLLTTLVISSLSLSAQAQTSVVVYGLLDLGLAKSTNEVTVLRENRASRLGFRGTEDLGNGLSAFFNLEIQIQADTGAQVGALFNRQANVGLKGNFGSVALGRTKNITDGASSRVEPFKTDGVVGAINETILRAGVGSSRVSNALTYNSPKLKGVVGSLQVIASEVSDADAGYNVLVAFDDGPISVHGSYARPVQAAPSITEPDLFTVGAGYTIGPAKVTAAFARGETETAARGRFKGAVIGLTYQLGKTGEILASAGRLEQTTATFKDRDTLKEFGIGYTYFLSKRTNLYASAGNERVARIKSYNVGITHNF